MYNIITTEEIRIRLSKMYCGRVDNPPRPLHIQKIFCDYGKLGYVVFALEGSPPKGIAIYQPDHSNLIFIDPWLKTRRYYVNHISGLDNFKALMILKKPIEVKE